MLWRLGSTSKAFTAKSALRSQTAFPGDTNPLADCSIERTQHYARSRYDLLAHVLVVAHANVNLAVLFSKINKAERTDSRLLVLVYSGCEEAPALPDELKSHIIPLIAIKFVDDNDIAAIESYCLDADK